MLKQTFLARFVIIWRDEKRTVSAEFLAIFVSATACCVALEPVPARTRGTVFSQLRSTRESAPGVPRLDMSAFRRCADSNYSADSGSDLVFINFAKAATSIWPLRNGVTNAVNVPANHRFAFLQTRTGQSGPVSVTLRNCLSIFSNPTRNSSPPQAITSIGPFTFSVAAKDQRTGDHAGAARERFILYPSFVVPGQRSYRLRVSQ